MDLLRSNIGSQKDAGNEVKIDGVEYLIMGEEDILSIIEK
jgi:co-chaperonin GroES (HSP10)